MKKYAVIYGAGEAEGVEVIICRFWTVIDIWFVNKNTTFSKVEGERKCSSIT